MSVRFTTVSLSLSNSLPFYSHLLACLPDRLAFHTGEMIPKACIHAYTETHTHRQTHRHTDRLLHLQILTLTFIYTHRLHFCWFWRYDTHLVTVTSFPCPCLSLSVPATVPCALRLVPASAPCQKPLLPLSICAAASTRQPLSTFAADLPIRSLCKSLCWQVSLTTTTGLDSCQLTASLSLPFRCLCIIFCVDIQLRSKYRDRFKNLRNALGMPVSLFMNRHEFVS